MWRSLRSWLLGERTKAQWSKNLTSVDICLSIILAWGRAHLMSSHTFFLKSRELSQYAPLVLLCYHFSCRVFSDFKFCLTCSLIHFSCLSYLFSFSSVTHSLLIIYLFCFATIPFQSTRVLARGHFTCWVLLIRKAEIRNPPLESCLNT